MASKPFSSKNSVDTPDQVRIKAEIAARVLAQRHLIPFTKRFNPRYKDGWVHRDICRRLERFSREVAEGKSPRLMILMPPRHGKSELASRSFPAWHLGHYPHHEFIACSYNIDLARSFSRKVKQIIEDPSYGPVFPSTTLDPDNASNEAWGLFKQPGGYVAAGVGGGITGKGAHVLLIDDPVKNAEEADSSDNREKVWEWYLSTAYSRLAPGGGVLIIQCMTGDTPVLMPDGTERRLDTLRKGVEVATYENGSLATAKIAAWRSSGDDYVLKITMISGRVVRANGRHPFLTSTDEGLQWVRAQNLTTAHKIVALPVNGGSGKALSAALTDAIFQQSAAGSAQATTTSKSGLMATARRQLTLSLAALRASSIATASAWKRTAGCLPSKTVDAPSAGWMTLSGHPVIGMVAYALTTATPRVAYGAFYATTAMPQPGTQRTNGWRWPSPHTSAFTLDQVASIEPDGVEEVFDVQVERTENFIANGLVSHNTWWHDDDLAGRIQTMMKTTGEDDEYIDQFEVVKYPAIAEADEWLNTQTDRIERLEHSVDLIKSTDAEGYATAVNDSRVRAYARAAQADIDTTGMQLLRVKGEALHPERYDLGKLLRIRAQNNAGRWWSALYQQNPVPDDGGYFVREQFLLQPSPHKDKCNVLIAWDFAISEKKQNDYTVGTVGLQDDDDVLHFADQLRFKSGDAFHIVEAILNLAVKWYSPSLVLGFEDGQIYRSIEALLKRRMRERQFYPSITVLKPLTDKLARGRALQGRMQQGMVRFASGAPWFDSMRTEMLRFPAGAHDDQVDSAAWVAQMAMDRSAPAKAKARQIESWRDKLKQLGGTPSHMAA